MKETFTPRQGRDLMLSSRSVEEWEANVDRIKAAYAGGYPWWWTEHIVELRILAAAQKRHGWTSAERES